MKSYRKTVIILGVLYFAAVLALAVFIRRAGGSIPGREADIITLNDIAKDAENTWDDLKSLGETDRGVDFAVLDTTDNILYDSRPEAGSYRTAPSSARNHLPYSSLWESGTI